MSDIGPYGVTQNADAAAVTADALVGERAGNVTEHQASSASAPATFSTAPYVPPKAKTGLCRYKNCRRPTLGSDDYCERHQP